MSSVIPLLALFSIGGWPAPFTHVRIALALDIEIPAAVARGAVEEAGALWAPYCVAVVPADPASLRGGSPAPPVDAALTVRVAEPGSDAARAWSSPFASIRFLADGKPEPTILLHYDAIARGLGTISLGGTRGQPWPGAVRNLVLGRMIGRVVAHEIGHWVLRSRDHSTSGLMRGHHTTDELAEPGRASFALMPADVARLRATLTR